MIQSIKAQAPTGLDRSDPAPNPGKPRYPNRRTAPPATSSTAAYARKRLLIVDDHPMLRERLAQVIQAEPDLVVCGEAEDCSQALEAVESTQPDLAIVDLSLRNSSGLDLLDAIKQRHPCLKVLILSMHGELLHADRVLRAGARGYITKQEATRKILLAVRTVLAGGIYLSSRPAPLAPAHAPSQP